MSLGKSAGGLPPDSVVQREAMILEDSERLVNTYHDNRRFSMLKIALAPCSPFSVTRELMEET
jgi:cytosine/adenosine deaminase-related metal-dependent hydrolase